jgi:hypothetical protein
MDNTEQDREADERWVEGLETVCRRVVESGRAVVEHLSIMVANAIAPEIRDHSGEPERTDFAYAKRLMVDQHRAVTRKAWVERGSVIVFGAKGAHFAGSQRATTVIAGPIFIEFWGQDNYRGYFFTTEDLIAEDWIDVRPNDVFSDPPA